MNGVAVAGVSADPIDVDALAVAVGAATAGALVTFAGVVRNHDRARAVDALEYHAHPTADSVVAEVAAEIVARYPAVSVAVQHRIGTLVVGDVALGAAVSSAHRREAFAACSELVDLVKERLPVWKRQLFADGTDEWVGST
ncbi:molybdenum cofactor biosynthesis protein MoaE [Nakamurella sp. A5-74]|uniref:Molybdenum cofactor biosynthesis protein MoaE n=1 Tax=Nakamurella sp. A5-74 TaxID=3158264 RepID=A0AAU8DQI2_9ACTN